MVCAIHCQNVSVKSSRLLAAPLPLQARGRMTAAQLARELEVSVRTVYRDVEALHAAGVPLFGDAPAHGRIGLTRSCGSPSAMTSSNRPTTSTW